MIIAILGFCLGLPTSLLVSAESFGAGFETKVNELSDFELDCRSQREPGVDCIAALFTPLSQVLDSFGDSFDPNTITANGFYISPSFQMTALHVLEQNAWGRSQCHLGEFQFYGSPQGTSGCGEVLFAGGDPFALSCRDSGVPISLCAVRVPNLLQAFDIALALLPMGFDAGRRFLKIEDEAKSVEGETVFAIGYPHFRWLTIEEKELLSERWTGQKQKYLEAFPLVSKGSIRSVGPRVVETDLVLFKGHSGGPLLNASGRAIGVSYGTKIRRESQEPSALAMYLGPGAEFHEQYLQAFAQALSLDSK